MSDLKVGDLVYVSNPPYECACRSVARVMKRFIELSDGSKWGHSQGWRFHHPYPKETWGRRTMEAWDAERHARPVRLHRARGALALLSGSTEHMRDTEIDELCAVAEEVGRRAKAAECAKAAAKVGG